MAARGDQATIKVDPVAGAVAVQPSMATPTTGNDLRQVVPERLQTRRCYVNNEAANAAGLFCDNAVIVSGRAREVIR